MLEKGTYSFYVGNSAENLEKCGQVWDLTEDRIVCQLESKGGPCKLPKRLVGDGSYEKLPQREEEPEVLGLPEQNMDLLEGLEPADRG